jgi:hypothetical protein
VADFSIFPHVDNPDLPKHTMAAAERWAAGLSTPAYAIDDETAIQVVDGEVSVTSEGRWKLFTHEQAGMVRRSSARGRPMRAGGGRSGWMKAHCWSVR